MCVPPLVESFLLGKSGDRSGGEDHIAVTDGFVGLFDGVTGRGRALDEQLRLDGQTPGRWAARTLGDALGSLPPAATMAAAVDALTGVLVAGMARLGVDPHEWGWPAAAQMVVFSAARREIWRLGDVHVAVNGRALPETPTPLDGPAADFRAAVLWALIASGATRDQLRADDPSWAMLLPLLEVQHHLRNGDDVDNPFAYGLLDGRRVHPKFFDVTAVAPGDEVVFASDGYLSPAPSLAAAQAELAEAVVSDPLLIGKHRRVRPVAPGHVSFDDRAYLKFRV